MDAYITEWLNLIFRFLHLITGIAWIGASFYFVWLDNHLQNPPQWKKDKGIKGDLWAIHGGGFYEVAKYELAPDQIPAMLHWFKWEAYSTWITGFLLLSLMYYVNAETYLIDRRIAELSQLQAIAIGLSTLVIGWLVYNILCNSTLAKHGALLGLILLLLITGLSYTLAQLFSSRGAYIHVGAVIGTVMVANVFFVIIPSQKALVAAVKLGQRPAASWALKAKLRSTHNTYSTLPLLFIMISNHYPITYNHHYNWAILVAIILITAAARWYFVLRHSRKHKSSILIAAGLATILLAYLIAPKSVVGDLEQEPQPRVNIADVERIIKDRCSSCHSATPTDDVFTTAPGGVLLDNQMQIQQWAKRIKSRTVDSADMPFMNKTEMTEEERYVINRWGTQNALTEKQ